MLCLVGRIMARGSRVMRRWFVGDHFIFHGQDDGCAILDGSDGFRQMNKNDTSSTRSATRTEIDLPPPQRFRLIAALYNRNFRCLWVAQLCTAFVQRMGDVVMGWLILEMTRSPFLVGLVIALRRVGTLLGPWAGVMADRMDRRRLALVSRTAADHTAVDPAGPRPVGLLSQSTRRYCFARLRPAAAGRR